MIKLKTVIIILIIYSLSYISIIYDLNLLYPYYLFKDLVFLPVNALTKDNEIIFSDNFNHNIYESLSKEIEDLKKMTNIKTVLSEFNYINGTIILRNREYWFNTITIDKGSNYGINVDMAVIDSNGLIGRISSVRPNTSDIKLITTNDVTNKISVVIKNNNQNIYGIISGYDSKFNLLKVIINEDIDIYDEMQVETTGMGGIFPKGILIGKVFDTMLDKDGVSMIVRVRPSANLEEIRYVSVLQRKEIVSD